jgi:hypothetical protein
VRVTPLRPSRVAGLGRRGTVRVAVRASLSLENRPRGETRGRALSSEDAHASASRGEALKQVQTRPLQPVATMAKNIANLERVRAFRSLPARRL